MLEIKSSKYKGEITHWLGLITNPLYVIPLVPESDRNAIPRTAKRERDYPFKKLQGNAAVRSTAQRRHTSRGDRS